MKKVLLTLSLVVLLVPLLSTPASAAYLVDLPIGAVGVSKKTLNELRSANCYYEYQPGTVENAYGGYCDALVGKYEGKIIYNQRTGAMFWINTADGLPLLNRYLPDGFYAAKYKGRNRYYWVTNGFRTRIHLKQDPFGEIVTFTQNNPANSVVGLSNTTASILLDHDEECTDRTSMEAACIAQRALMYELKGKTVMLTEQNGELFYIFPDGYTMTSLTAKNVKTVLTGDNMTHVKFRRIKKLVPSWIL